MRCNKNNFFKEVRDTKSDDEIIYIAIKGHILKSRVVTIQINGKDYTFITNLTDKRVG